MEDIGPLVTSKAQPVFGKRSSGCSHDKTPRLLERRLFCWAPRERTNGWAWIVGSKIKINTLKYMIRPNETHKTSNKTYKLTVHYSIFILDPVRFDGFKWQDDFSFLSEFPDRIFLSSTPVGARPNKKRLFPGQYSLKWTLLHFGIPTAFFLIIFSWTLRRPEIFLFGQPLDPPLTCFHTGEKSEPVLRPFCWPRTVHQLRFFGWDNSDDKIYSNIGTWHLTLLF